MVVMVVMGVMVVEVVGMMVEVVGRGDLCGDSWCC